METIYSFISKVRKRMLVSGILRVVLSCAFLATAMLVVFVLCDYFFQLKLFSRRMYFNVTLIVAALAATKEIFRLVKKLGYNSVISDIQQKLPLLKDNLLSAHEFMIGKSKGSQAKGISDELVVGHINSVGEILKNSSAYEIHSVAKETAGYLKVFLAAAAVSVLLMSSAGMRYSCKRIIFSYRLSDWGKYFTVEPRDLKVVNSSSVEIKARGTKLLKGSPVVNTRLGNENWSRYEMERGSNGEYNFEVRSVTEPLEYYVAWGEWESDAYKITPVQYPKLGDFAVKYIYPSYTHMPEQLQKGDPAVAGLFGTRVEVSAEATQDILGAEVVFDGGQTSKVALDGKKVKTSFRLDKQQEYYFKIQTAENLVDPDPPKYRISIVKDSPPSIELISPKEDIVAAADATVPLVYEVSDDFEVASVRLVTRKGAEAPKITEIRAQPVANGVYQYDLKLSRYDLAEGEKISYYIEAFDNDVITGPKSSSTKPLSVEAMNYEKKHQDIEEGLKTLKDSLLDVLADQTVAKQETEGLQNNFSTSTYSSALSKQKDIKSKMNDPVAKLQDLLGAMENDPGTDLSTYSEYKGLEDHMKHMKDGILEKAERSLGDKDIGEALKDQKEAIANLEKMSLLAEDIWQYQKMRDMMDSGSKLSDLGKDLMGQVSSKSSPDELKKTLDKIDGLFKKIADQLSKMPKDLPEDFVNSQAVKNIDMAKSQDLMKKLNDAVSAGRWDEAGELAKELEKQLDSLMKTFDEVGNDIGFSSGASEKKSSKINEMTKALQGIISGQQDMNQQMDVMDGVRRKNVFAKQESMLKELAARQREVIAGSNKMFAKLSRFGFYYDTARISDLMKRVLDEFESQRAYHSQNYLTDIITTLSVWEQAVKEAETVEMIKYVNDREKSILEKLKAPVTDDVFSQQEKSKLGELSGKQKEIAKTTDSLRHSMEEFLRTSTAIEPEVFENMYDAARQMDSASGSLSASDSSKALESGHRALELLLKGQEGMSESGGKMSSEGSGAGKPKGSVMGSKVNGMTGIRVEPVKLPDANEYKPPREFRQEIMDAVKEKYPKQYEQIIKDYYRKLVQ
jgi:hypothetical protein